ncbi:MAG: hypothetical protein ACRDKT_06195 [Actinomycetota bacterium]
METLPTLGVVAVLGLALVHLFAGTVAFGDRYPRSAWVSAAAGTSVAYVFVHLLPELATRQADLSREVMLSRETDIYIAALVGLIMFYALEHASRRSRHKRAGTEGDDKTSRGVFWASTLSYGLFNVVLGYGLGRQADVSLTELVLFTIVIGVHFLMSDASLRKHHKDDYDRVGRWILAGSVVLGWLVSLPLSLPALTIELMFGLAAGGIVLTVLKEELTEQEPTGAFWAFVAGAAGYVVLLLLFL